MKSYIVNAFTYLGSGGNPAGVVLDANGLTSEERQKVAAQLGLSETAFLEKLPNHDYQLEFFTPTRPIANCGHATIATFALLASQGLEKRKQVTVHISGNAVQIYFDQGSVYMDQKPGTYEHLDAPEIQAVLHALQLDLHSLMPNFRPRIGDTSNRFFLVGVKTKQDLKSIVPDLKMISELSEIKNTIGFYVFTLEDTGHFAASTRMFAPAYGIDEESATGMAAGPLACALIDHLGFKESHLKIAQGELMSPPRLSEISAVIEMVSGKIVGLRVGGTASESP